MDDLHFCLHRVHLADSLARNCVHFVGRVTTSGSHSSSNLFLFLHPNSHSLAMNLTTGATIPELLALDNIRTQLIRLEDTIIFCASASTRSEGAGRGSG